MIDINLCFHAVTLVTTVYYLLQIFGTSLPEMSDHLDQGDVAETVKVFFEKSKKITPQSSSSMSLQEVDEYLEQMSKVTREEDQQNVLTNVTKRYVSVRLLVLLLRVGDILMC